MKSSYFDLTNINSLNKKWDLTIVSDSEEPRAIFAKNFLIEHTKKLISLSYTPDDFTFTMKIDDEKSVVYTHDLSDSLAKYKEKSIIIDATSFDIASLTFVCKILKELEVQNIDILYIEPNNYEIQRTFDENDYGALLSDSTLGFEEAPIPGTTKPIDQNERNYFIFLLGYEGDRLTNAFEKLDFHLQRYEFIFGVPSFIYGWERISFTTHADILLEKNSSAKDLIHYCGANNIVGTHRLIQKLKKEMQCDNIFLVPLGTKLMGLAAIKAMCEDTENTFILYDYPNKTSNRTTGTHKIHLIESFL